MSWKRAFGAGPQGAHAVGALPIRGFKRTRALVGKVPASAGTHRENQATVALTILPGARGGSPLGRASICSIPLST